MAKVLENIEKDISALPASLKVFLTDTVTVEKIKSITDSFGFDGVERLKIEKIIADIVAGDLNLYDVTTEIADQLGLELEAAMDVNGKLYEDLFFDLEDDINVQYTAHQIGKVEKIEKEPIVAEKDIEKSQKEKSEFEPLIDKAVKKFNLFAAPPSVILSGREGSRDSSVASLPQNDTEEMKKKFSEMAETFLSNVRTKAQFKNTLMKPIADGGIGMDKTTADLVAEFLASYSRLEPIIAKSEEKKKNDTSISVIPSGVKTKPRDLTPSKKETGEISPLVLSTGLSRNDNPPRPVPPNVKIEVSFEKEEKEAAPPPSVIPAKAGIQFVKNKEAVDFSREEKEAAAKKPKIEKMRIAAPKLLSVTEGVTKALEELNYTFPSSELQERLKSVIDARVRNVRNSIQTFDKLTQDIPSGGLGFSKLEADRVSLVLNKYLEDKNKDIYGSKLAEIKQAEDEEKNKNEERARAAEEAEKKNLDERFTKMTGKAPPPVIASEARQSPPALTKKEIATKKQISLPPEEAPYSVIPSGVQTESRDLTSSKKQTGGISPLVPKTGLGRNDTKREVPPPPRPVLEDIKFTPKLAGPTEEIARLSADDFRKLSGDPKEAVMKIKDKLALLRGESYKKYQAGIEAWRNSPLYSEYLKIINKSLSEGTPLDTALASAKTLTKDEFDAIINSRIE